MKRREFLKRSVPLTAAPIYLSGVPISAMTESANLAALTNAGSLSDRCLVLVFLDGGNDGLNTLIPIDQYDVLMRDGSGGDSQPLRRPDLMIPKNKILKLNGLDDTGLHSTMEKFQTLFGEDKLGFVRNVGYPNPNKSHFRSTDIWNSGSSSDEFVTSGWFGRYLSSNHPSFPDGYPNSNYPDPLALSIGNTASNTCQGPIINMGVSIKNLNNFIDIKEGGNNTPDTPYGHELQYIRTASKLTNEYFDRLEEASEKGGATSIEYPGYKLAEQLKIVAQLIAGGVKSKIFVVRIGGFDTHDNQVDEGNPETGRHALLMEELSESLFSFQQDIIQRNLEERVLTMTYSEFGRRVSENGSEGTDHGSAAPVMLFGSPLRGSGFIGSHPSLSNLNRRGNMYNTIDFRSIYQTVLTDWLCGDSNFINAAMLGNEYDLLGLGFGCQDSDVVDYNSLLNYHAPIYSNYDQRVNLNLRIQQTHKVNIKTFDILGRHVNTIFSGDLIRGEHEFSISHNKNGKLSAGQYFYRINLVGGPTLSKAFVVR